MKILTVYHVGDTWYGSEVEWARSGSGYYRQTRLITIPQSREEIEEFARERGYRIEWLDPLPNGVPAGSATASQDPARS